MGSDVVPGSSLLESKCELPLVERLIKPVDVYSPAARGWGRDWGLLTYSSSIHTCTFNGTYSNANAGGLQSPQENSIKKKNKAGDHGHFRLVKTEEPQIRVQSD